MKESPDQDFSHHFKLESLEKTKLLAVACATVITRQHPEALLFFGDLGAGKTTFIRELVQQLPGADDAEVSSPSFTIANFYYTDPPVHHFDLYRLQDHSSNETLEDSFETPETLTVVEWSERLAQADYPLDGVLCRFVFDPATEGRELHMKALGAKGTAFLALLQAHVAA